MFREVASYIPGGDPVQAQKYINSARRTIYDLRNWSFLIAETNLYSPAIITVGNATTTFGSLTVTFDSTASAALLSLSFPILAKRQFRIAGASAVYNIATVDQSVPTAIVITLDRPYTEPTQTGAYQVYRAYYEPTDLTGNPTTDFIRWIGIKVVQQGYTIAGTNLFRTNIELDIIDPQRSSQGNPYWCVTYKSDPNNNFAPLYELWPHPTSAQGLPTLYKRRGLDLVAPSDILPIALSERCVVDKAIVLLCEWAEANKGAHPEYLKVNWLNLCKQKELSFRLEYNELRKKDNSTFISNWITNPYHGGRFGPYDSNFMQSHDTTGWGLGGY